MAERSSITFALVLSLSNFGEGHREAVLLTKEQRLQRAAVFGGAKSKLRALVSPWQTGRVWLYTDPVKKFAKITDFDVLYWRQGIRENLVRTWCASFCVELVTRSHGIADWTLVNAFLDGISISNDYECKIALLRFIWRSLLNAGLAPDLVSCSDCGMQTDNTVLFYSVQNESCVCETCCAKEEHCFRLSKQAVAYLSAIEHISPQAVRLLQLTEQSTTELKHFLFFLASRMIGGAFKTLETGNGIL